MTNPIQILATDDLLSYTGRRLRKRQVNEVTTAKWTARRAQKADTPIVDVRHGGEWFGHRDSAETEGLVTVAFSDGRVCQWGCRLSASKVTHSGVLAACLGDWARPIRDPRYSTNKAQEAHRMLLEIAEHYLDDEESNRRARENFLNL